MTSLTWLITGSSRGFGRALVDAAASAGDRVVATARKPEQLDDLVEKYGDRVLPVALDVTDPDAALVAMQKGVDRFGRLDVIVNNAGYANIAPVETADEADFRRQFDTNFWGVYYVSKAALPILRSQGGGTIVQFSSIGGRVGQTPGLGSYQAAKFAVDGLTRVLAAETGTFGIRYLVIEPGGFATDWAGSSMELHDVPAEYQDTVGSMRSRIQGSAANLSAGDPTRAAEIIVNVVRRDRIPTHLIVGGGAADMGIDYSRRQIEEATTWLEVSRSADFGAPYPVRLPDETGE
jgi:NAD(P)-dependent dehydrogenase (short-subunit alcohol dehydrogenase family)